jgi:hypothetical protein
MFEINTKIKLFKVSDSDLDNCFGIVVGHYGRTCYKIKLDNPPNIKYNCVFIIHQDCVKENE